LKELEKQFQSEMEELKKAYQSRRTALTTTLAKYEPKFPDPRRR